MTEAGSRGTGWHAKPAESMIATEAEQTYEGALVCKNAYDGEIALRIKASGRKTLTHGGGRTHRPQAV